MAQNDACFSLSSIYFRNFAKLLQMQYPKLPRKHARHAYYAQILTGYFCALRNRKCLSFESANPRRCVSCTRGDARMHNVTMQIADGPRQKCLLARFAVGAAPEAADFNYESSTADRRAHEYFSRPGR